MKKISIVLCMLTCIFGLTACGSKEEMSQMQQSKVSFAEQRATEMVLPTMQLFADDNMKDEFLAYTPEELEYLFENQIGMKVEGAGIMGGISSFNASMKDVGEIISVGTPKSKVEGNTIVVQVPVTGSAKDAEAEVIFENTFFMTVESCALNPKATMGELMEKAALNTLLGMGTVFAVLILISFIISSFSLIPKLQEKLAKKNKENDTESVDKTIAQIVEKEELSDDLELVAVIAAAVAAYSGTSTDGFVVRSIKRANKRK